MQNFRNRRSVQKCAQNTGSNVLKKPETNPFVLKQKGAEIKHSKNPAVIEIYIDDLIYNYIFSGGVVSNEDIFSARLPDMETIFSAKANAV